MDTYNLIKDAILKTKVVKAIYKGHVRIMCPHVLGRKGNRYQALFFQFGGHSSSGLDNDVRKNWRCMFLDELSSVTTETGKWHTAPNHSRPQECVDEIHAEWSSRQSPDSVPSHS